MSGLSCIRRERVSLFLIADGTAKEFWYGDISRDTTSFDTVEDHRHLFSTWASISKMGQVIEAIHMKILGQIKTSNGISCNCFRWWPMNAHLDVISTIDRE